MTTRDAEGRAFLAWALPRLGLRWDGFRGVHGQVVKRVLRRARALELPDLTAYRALLERDSSEWRRLDGLCRITISRFWREGGVFELLRAEVFPALATGAGMRGDEVVRVLCLGAAGGEEPYSLRIAWDHQAARPVELSIVALEADAEQIARARAGLYDAGALAELPPAYRREAFDQEGERFRVRDAVRRDVELVQADVRDPWPPGPFDLVTCRNLAFTYFDAALQDETLGRIERSLHPGGALVIGRQERLPPGSSLVELAAGSNVFRKP